MDKHGGSYTIDKPMFESGGIAVRRHIYTNTTARRRALVYLAALIAMAIYAIPQLPKLQTGLPGTFSMLWILFLALAIAANTYFMVGADVERRRMLEEQAVVQKVRQDARESKHVQRSLGR